MTRNRLTTFALVCVLVAVPFMTGCGQKVRVETGTKVVCTYGHEISNDVETVEVRAKDVSNYKVRTTKRTCQKHLDLEKLYAEAQAAIKKGDLKTAQKKLAQVVEGDEAFRLASAQLEAIQAGKKPTVDTDTSAPSQTATKTPEPGTGDTSGPVGSLLKYTPDVLKGFNARKPLTDPNAIVREYEPSGSSQAILMTAFVEQERSSAVAKVMLTREVKDAYPRSAATVKIGSRSGYFGTDGSRYASIGFTDGSIFVAYEMAAKRGTDPLKLKDELIDALEQIP